MAGLVFRNHPGILHVNTTRMCALTHTNTHAHTYLLKQLPRIRWIFVRLLPKINVARCVCACVHSCTCVSVLSFVSSQLNLSNPPTPHCSLSLLFLPISLSDEQIELLNELFLWAPNAHPQLSICSFPPSARLLLPPSPHPSTPSPLFPQPHSYFPNLPAATMFTVYLQAQEHMYAHTFTVTYMLH